MGTVDLAAYHLAVDAGVIDKVEFRRPWYAHPSRNGATPPEAAGDRWPIPFRYGLEPLDLHPETTAILFWGDFQHGRDYLIQSARRLDTIDGGQGRSEGETLDLLYRYFMMEGSDFSSKIMMCGGTLFQNSVADYADLRYLNALSRLYSSADYARARDPYSAGVIARLRRDYATSYLGVDAALLNQPRHLEALEQESPKVLADFDGAVGIFFGRSSASFPFWRASFFMKELASAIKAPLAWIPWDRFAAGRLFYSRRHRFQRKMKFAAEVPRNVDVTVGDVLNLLRRCRLIITDTYHMAVNAIAFNTPVVCVYEPSPASERDCNIGHRAAPRDKRVSIFTSYDLSEFIVPTSDLTDAAARRLRAHHIAECIESSHSIEPAYSGIRAHAAACRRELIAHIQRHLNVARESIPGETCRRPVN